MANAMLAFLKVFLLISGFRGATEAAPTLPEHQSCQIWDGLAKQLTTSTGAQQVCRSTGSPCTRIDCNGAYEYNSQNIGPSFFNLGSKTFEVDYCFGVILNHCSKNISLDFYMQVPDRRINQNMRVYHNTLLSIPGLSYFSNSSDISAQGYLYFQMERRADSVTFSVTVKVRLKFASIEYWPDKLQRRLIRNETVPVPPCEPGASNSSSAIPDISQCHPPRWKDGKLPASDETKGVVSGDLDKLCNETESCTRDPWLACDQATNRCVCDPDFEKIFSNKLGGNTCIPKIRHGKVCQSDDDCSLAMSERCFNGVCDCQEGDYFNKLTQTCEPKHQGKWTVLPPAGATQMPHIATEPATAPSETKTGSQSKAAVIAGAVVGGLVVLGGLLFAAYFAIRRLRRPYNNRELLLEGEDSDGVM